MVRDPSLGSVGMTPIFRLCDRLGSRARGIEFSIRERYPSFPWKRESMEHKPFAQFWISASAEMTEERAYKHHVQERAIALAAIP